MNNSFNIGRQKLLLELIKNITQQIYPSYDDRAIKSNIFKYISLVKALVSIIITSRIIICYSYLVQAE